MSITEKGGEMSKRINMALRNPPLWFLFNNKINTHTDCEKFEEVKVKNPPHNQSHSPKVKLK